MTGTVPFARLDGRMVMAEWRRRQLAHEVMVEWTLTLDGQPLLVRDKQTGAPSVIALHHWDDGHERPRDGVQRADGIWEIDVPIAWHTMCVAVSGALKLELDADQLQVIVSEDLHVEL